MAKDRNSKLHQKIVGLVISHKPNLTAVVRVTNHKVHPKYKKRYTTTNKFSAHDPDNICQEGDTVEIIPSRPFSKTKRFIVSKKL